MLAGVDRIDAGDDVDVLDDIGEQFGALQAQVAQGRIVARNRFGIGMADEYQRRGSLLLEEPGQPHADDNECNHRAQPGPAPPRLPHWRSAFSSAPNHIRSVTILIADRALLDYGVFDLDDFACGSPTPSSPAGTRPTGA